MERTINQNGVVIVKFDMSISEDRLAKDTIKKTKHFYNRNTCEWSVYGFDSIYRFDKFVLAGINGESLNKNGVKPTKSALKEQQKAFWSSEEGKAIKEKRRNWVMEQNRKKFDYVKERFNIAVATVIEEICANDRKLAFYKLTDQEIESMSVKYQDKIADVLADMLW